MIRSTSCTGRHKTLRSGWLAAGVLLLCCAGIAVSETSPPFTIHTDFPGGNSIVDRVEGDTVYLRPDLHDTEGWWFYWNFKLAGVPVGHTLTFDFGERNPIGVRGPAVSTDTGATWDWLGSDNVQGATFTYTFPEGGNAWFSFTIPYLESDLRAFLKKWEGSDSLVAETLCDSRGGRKVEALRAGCIAERPKYRVLLTARHHACETMASFVLEGILAAMLADDEDGTWFRENVEALAIPFMDKDGVEAGDQGKNRRPRDHNRDYDEASIYPETKALKTHVVDWSDGLLRVALDLHCPYIRGEGNEVIYLVGSPNKVTWERQQRFAALLEEVNNGPLPYRASDNLPFGKRWNTAANYGQGVSFARWAETIPGVTLSTTIEIPYANTGGHPVTAESARAFGTSIARALRRYLTAGEDLPE